MKNLDALGMVETRGFVSLVEAANAMAQMADVDLVHYEKVGYGFTTIIVRGPLEEVRRAVGAGVNAAKRVGDIVAAHVLPRVHPKAERLLPLGRRELLELEKDGSPGTLETDSLTYTNEARKVRQSDNREGGMREKREERRGMRDKEG